MSERKRCDGFRRKRRGLLTGRSSGLQQKRLRQSVALLNMLSGAVYQVLAADTRRRRAVWARTAREITKKKKTEATKHFRVQNKLLLHPKN